MVLFNYSTKELTAKIVYYGPGLCGKTTNLQFIYESLPQEKKGRMLSLSTQTDRTLYFDFLPLEIGEIRGLRTRVQLYTVPGQVFYNETRKLVLKGVDGVVFVADSQKQMAEHNLESYRNLEENLKIHGLDLPRMPLVLQFNKRDLPSILSVEEMNSSLNKYNSPFYEAIAATGIGVHDTLKAISKLVLHSLSGQYKDDKPHPVLLPPGVPGAAAEAPRKPSPPRAAPPKPASPRPAPRWEDESLESELDQMDAREIEGLLADVDEVDSQPAPLAARGHRGPSSSAMFAPARAEPPPALGAMDDLDLEEPAAPSDALAATDFTLDDMMEAPAASPRPGPEGLDELGLESGSIHDAPDPFGSQDHPRSERALEDDALLEDDSAFAPPASGAGAFLSDLDAAPETEPAPTAVLAEGLEVVIPIQLSVGGREHHYRLLLRLTAAPPPPPAHR